MPVASGNERVAPDGQCTCGRLKRKVSRGTIANSSGQLSETKLFIKGVTRPNISPEQQAYSRLSRSLEGFRALTKVQPKAGGASLEAQQIEPAVHVVGNYIVYGSKPGAAKTINLDLQGRSLFP